MTFGARFLVSPSLFPARLAGETWGELDATLDLPGGPFRLRGLSASQRESLGQRYDTSGDGEGFDLTIYRAPREDFREIDTRGWEYSLDYETSGTSISIAGMNLMARLDLSRNRAAIWTPVDDVASFWGVVENVLRPLVAERLLMTGGLLVHSAAIALDGQGILFAGPSGAGKSTVSRLALDARHAVLSDDLNALVRDGERFRLLPLPFTGDLTREELSSTAVPLQALVKLEKGDEEKLRPMHAGIAASLLVSAAPYVNQDAARTQLLLERADEIASTATRVVLTFRRDGSIWPILRALR
ncbi:MAG TPA: hypothetical protein VGF69_15180 [Thermoanaerobaculia bacterium]|jgi:hypothetical protein